MTPSEAAKILAVAAAFDRRTVGEADAHAWSLALPDITVEMANDAIIKHYRQSREFIMPSDVAEIVAAIRRHRRDAVNQPVPPVELPDHKYGDWIRAFWAAVEDGAVGPEAEMVADQKTGTIRNGQPAAIESAEKAHEIRMGIARMAREMNEAEHRKAAEKADRREQRARRDASARALEAERKSEADA